MIGAGKEFEERANHQLDDFEAMLEHTGATVEHRLVFTHEADAT